MLCCMLLRPSSEIERETLREHFAEREGERHRRRSMYVMKSRCRVKHGKTLMRGGDRERLLTGARTVLGF